MSEGLRFSIIERDEDYLTICVSFQDEITTSNDWIYINDDGVSNLIFIPKKFQFCPNNDKFSFAPGSFQKKVSLTVLSKRVCFLTQ